jgi:hypothetical protein
MRIQSMARVVVALAVMLMSACTEAVEPPACGFPFELREGLIWLKVQVQESPKPLNMLLDSGANYSVINLSTARRLRVKLGEPVKVQGVDTVTTGYWPQHLAASIQGAALPTNFLALDITELRQGSECVIDGLLGADFFATHVVRIDFARNRIFLDSAARSLNDEVEIPLRVKDESLQVPVCVNSGRQQWVRLDTGCNSAFHWVNADVQQRHSAPHVAVALTTVRIPVTQCTVQLGGFTLDGVSTGLHQAPIFAGESGLLGTGLLSRFSAVIIDAPSKRVYLDK